MGQELLFNKYDIHGVLRNQTEAVKQRVLEVDPNTILSISEGDLVASLVQEFRLDVPVINDDEIHIAHSGETPVDVSHDYNRAFLDGSRPFYIQGTKTVIAIPFDGEAVFFNVQPQTFTLNPPRGEISKGELHLTYIRTDQDGNAIRQEFQRTLSSIKEYLSSLTQSTTEFNGKLEALISELVKKRKAKLLADAGMTAAIGLPMKKRGGTPATYTVPVTRRAPKIEKMKVTGAFKPEPALAEEDYQEILHIMKNMVKVMELSPHAFHNMGEEDIRSHFLVQLNGAYNGQATGETFNFQGKTDILIRVDGKNVFIAECKVWKGEKVLLATIDQLLSYLSWRDTKSSVVIFNRNAGFTDVLSKIAEAVPTHPHFKRHDGKPDESSFRYVFSQPNDINREIVLTVLAFDIPTAPAIKAMGAGKSFDKDAKTEKR